MSAKWFLLCGLFFLVGIVGAFVACGDDDDDDDGGSDDDDNNDTSSGNLTWQDPPLNDFMTWDEAISYCEALSYNGHDDWRLPTISELRSLIRGCDATEIGGACSVSDGCTETDCLNDSCTGCEYLEGPGSGGAYWPDEISGAILIYWSSSLVADLDFPAAWCVLFNYGEVNNVGSAGSTGMERTRCVR